MGYSFGDCVKRYYTYKWIREADKAAEKRREERRRKKAEKKMIIATYGYDYYLRERTWRSIKNQKKRETFDQWRYRLALYGFTIEGYDTQNGQQHYSKPLVHEYRFEEEPNIIKKEESAETMNKVWNEILSSFSENPRDVLTYGKRKYFYVYAENGDLYVESGRSHSNASEIKIRRRLDKENFDDIYEEYKSGSKPSDIVELTYNSVYWMGIFRELGL